LVGVRTGERKWRSAIARGVQACTGAPSVEEGVASLASEMLKGIESPPTAIEELCRRSGILIAPSDDLIGSGALVSDGATLQILYARDLSVSRRRFTIAHEIGHIALRRVAPGRVSPSNELERLCDIFATELLMPKPVFLRETEQDFHLSGLSNLAHRFRVSLTSTAIRLAELRKVSIFETDNTEVRWGVGIVRRGPVNSVDDALKPWIKEALKGRCGTTQVFLSVKESVVRFGLEYWPIGKTGRSLIMLRKLPLRGILDGASG
jgi:Zn-dependent peptidase ImmA (M78 family)